MAAARLQRWALLLSAYSYDIQFKHTQDHANADGLSRLSQGNRQPPDTESAFVVGIQALPVTGGKLETTTRQGKILNQVHMFIKEGWPTKTDEEFKPFRDRQNELSTQGQVILWGNCVVIPEKLRTTMIDELHQNHPGVVRMKRPLPDVTFGGQDWIKK